MAMAMVGLRAWPLWRVLRRVRPATPERLAAAARTGRYDGRIVAVAGVASAGPGGPLVSTINQVSCVWHRHTVHRRRIYYRATAGGVVQRGSISRRVAHGASAEPFRLGEVEVRPAGMRVHRPLACAPRILPALATEPFPDADELMGRPPYLYRHREWVLRPGVPLFVLGQLRTVGSRVTLRRPDRGPHVISTWSVRRLRAWTAVVALGSLTIAAGAGIAAIVVFVASR
jgi:E3 Ubiquitin ligase.